ncbi:MAG: hypothetical protein PWP34_1539 [Desulfuromonadales bacterium]|jgi:hypothetical protein|nr:hypothetical protein [Desulfuromonadales bacterium]
MNVIPSHPDEAFGAHQFLPTSCNRSSRFSPPDGYPLSQAGTSSLLRNLLPPRTASKDPQVSSWDFLTRFFDRKTETIRGFPSYLPAPCKRRHPQSRYGSDQVSGFALFRTLTHPQRRIRFACAMCRLLPIASFRPCRCQQRPCDSDCLPPDRGDACFLQQAGFASSAGQTKKSPAVLSAGLLLR